MEELEARVTALENQVGAIRQDAAAARVLAGGADRDVSAFGAKLDTHKKLLDALRETQIEHGEILKGHSREFVELKAEMRGGFADVKGEMVEMRGEMAEMRGGFAEVKGEMVEMRDEITGMRGGFAMLAAGQAKITTLLERHLATDE
jgi:hypothetical protein